MGSHRPAHHLTAADKAELVGQGICPYCMGRDDPGGPISETLADHCINLFGSKHRQCRQAWLVCEKCDAYGPTTNFVRGD